MDGAVAEQLAVYPGNLSDATQLQGSALAFTITKTTCSDPTSQTPNSDGDQCKCQKGFFDADKDDGDDSDEKVENRDTKVWHGATENGP